MFKDSIIGEDKLNIIIDTHFKTKTERLNRLESQNEDLLSKNQDL
jgi:hypothetical protein